MPEVVVVGSFTALPGKEDQAVAAFSELIPPTHAEDGCILFSLHQSTEDAQRLALIERWVSQELLDEHLDSPHVQKMLGKADDLFGGNVEIVVYEAIPAGEPKKGALATHASS